MTDKATDALALGMRIVAVLETGRRTATYKLATMMALVDFCVEHLPEDPASRLDVPIDGLAHRVTDFYWRQVNPLAGYGQLKQSSQPKERIPAAVASLRTRALAQGVPSLDVARERMHSIYEATLAEVSLTMVQQPLHRLQHLPGAQPGGTFLYDDSWMHDQVSRRTVEAHGARITLYPGVGAGLARLAGLLRPTLEILWVEDVARLNRALLGEAHLDLAGHLFGQERTGLGRVREALYEEFGPECFYCEVGLKVNSPIDHVLPWSRAGLDGLANLVPACGRCNTSKSNALPALEHMVRAFHRPHELLSRIGREIAWPVQHQRTRSAARGMYLSAPSGTPLWLAQGDFTVADISFADVQW